MQVKLLMGFNGLRADGMPWPPVGTIMELPDGVAHGLIANGHAVAVNNAPAIERATIEAPAESATLKPKLRGRGKK